jgi:acyl-CoA thioesterase
MPDDGRAADRGFLGLAVDDRGVGAVEVTYKLMSPRGSFYGGAGLAIACAMMEHATTRSTVWCTVQFVSGAEHGDRLEFRTDVVAHGHRTSQVRVTGSVDGRELLTAVGATGAAGDRITQTFAAMPPVSPVDECAPVPWSFASEASDASTTHFGVTEIREAVVHAGTEGSTTPSMALWARLDGAPAWSPALLSYVADIVPMSIHRALGTRRPGGMSLDNSIRVGPPVDTEWVLMALHPEAARDGYGHGTVHLWSPDGALLGTASQTFALRSS